MQQLKPVCHDYWADALEMVSRNSGAFVPGVCAPQREKSPQWEAGAEQGGIAPACYNLGKCSRSGKDPVQLKTHFKKCYRPIIYGFFRTVFEPICIFGYRKSWGCIFNNCLSPYYLFSVLIFVFLLWCFLRLSFFSLPHFSSRLSHLAGI